MLTPPLRKKLKQVSDLIKKSSNILVVTHQDPDADAVGGLLGLGLALEKLKIKRFLFCSDSPPQNLSLLPIGQITNKKNFYNIDLVVALDYGDWQRTGITSNWPKIITLDHHPPENQIGSIKIVDTRFSSTCEIIYLLFKVMGMTLNKDIATCLLTGIFADTGGFQHANTGQNTLRVGGELLLRGARIYKIARSLSPNKNLPALKIRGLALSKIKKDPQTGMVVSMLSRDDIMRNRASTEDISGISSILNTVSGGKFSLFLTEYKKGKIKGSLRSEKYKGVDVSKIAKALGGGGHKLAAGFEVDGKLEEILERVKGIVKERISNF